MVKKNKVFKWEPTAMQKHPDSIKSSDFTNFKPFDLSYIKGRPDMCLLLSMEYSRKWFQEKEAYEKSLKPSTNIEFLQRNYVKRGLNRKRQIVDAKCHLQPKTLQAKT